MNMPVDAFLTALYTIVDDWYQAHGQQWLAHKPGAKASFSDSEVITLSLAQHWCGFATERAWLRFIAANYHPLFPGLLSQSEFNRRARNLCWLTNALRRWVVQQLDAYAAEYRLIDGTRSRCGIGAVTGAGICCCRARSWATVPPRRKPSTATGWWC
jgi:hypothetical protein